MSFTYDGYPNVSLLHRLSLMNSHAGTSSVNYMNYQACLALPHKKKATLMTGPDLPKEGVAGKGLYLQVRLIMVPVVLVTLRSGDNATFSCTIASAGTFSGRSAP